MSVRKNLSVRLTASAMGGARAGARFCPSLGLSLEWVREHLAQPNVACVGGGWIAARARAAAPSGAAA